MSYYGNKEFALEAAKGNVANHATVNKFGRNPDIDTATDPEDIWDGGGVWAAPTAARVHSIASTSATDDGGLPGTGARTIRVYGLADWDSAESSEVVTLDGTSGVNTAGSYVIIHRMKVLTAGSGNTNAGDITATAAAPDSTVTAQISAGKGQTLMAIYGIPSTQSLYITNWYMAANKAGAAGTAAVELRVAEDASTDVDLYTVKHHLGVATGGSSYIGRYFDPPTKVAGPAIIKVQGLEVSGNDFDISAGFDGYLVTE